jgi:hypothetical protein
VVQRLVGKVCFRGLARSYAWEFPSRSGNLGVYGAEFPTLLDVHYRDTGFAYLADVARLEWACLEADGAADAAPLEVVTLGGIPAERCPDLRFTLRAPVRLLSSRFPVFSIWEANQTDHVQPVALGAGSEHVLVTRRRRGLELFRLDAGTFAFVRSLADGESLADACAAGETAARDFTAAEALATLARLEVLAGFRLPGDDHD